MPGGEGDKEVECNNNVPGQDCRDCGDPHHHHGGGGMPPKTVASKSSAPFACHLCSRRFVLRQNLRRHLILKHRGGGGSR